MKDLEGGELEPYLKSEAVPADNSGPVTVAVAKNFEDVVTNNGKDTLIEVSAISNPNLPSIRFLLIAFFILSQIAVLRSMVRTLQEIGSSVR